jgi:hypothetical protein
VAVSFSAMNPPMDFQLEEMIIEAEFNMQVENVIKIHGRGERILPMATPKNSFPHFRCRSPKVPR